jgi:hypothetical protein
MIWTREPGHKIDSRVNAVRHSTTFNTDANTGEILVRFRPPVLPGTDGGRPFAFSSVQSRPGADNHGSANIHLTGDRSKGNCSPCGLAVLHGGNATRRNAGTRRQNSLVPLPKCPSLPGARALPLTLEESKPPSWRNQGGRCASTQLSFSLPPFLPTSHPPFPGHGGIKPSDDSHQQATGGFPGTLLSLSRGKSHDTLPSSHVTAGKRKTPDSNTRFVFPGGISDGPIVRASWRISIRYPSAH